MKKRSSARRPRLPGFSRSRSLGSFVRSFKTHLHSPPSKDLQLNIQPVHLQRSRILGPERAPVDSLVGVVPVESVEGDDGELIWDDFDGEVGSALEDVDLLGGDVFVPDAVERKETNE